MVRKSIVLLLSGIALLLSSERVDAQTILDKAERDETVVIPKDDPDMATAMRKARMTLPNFLALARAPTRSMTNFAIKVGIRADNGSHEYFWVRPFENKGNRYTGQLRNTP